MTSPRSTSIESRRLDRGGGMSAMAGIVGREARLAGKAQNRVQLAAAKLRTT